MRRVAVRRGGGDVLLQQPGADAPATSYDGAQAEYILRDYEGYVSVFASDADRRPLQVTGIEVAGLRRADQERCAAASPSAVRSSFCCCWRIWGRKRT
ncbi:MAG: hypothetical protein ACLSHG_09215 [Oscillospiraceae bacterium]